jgi:hypothetical protein
MKQYLLLLAAILLSGILLLPSPNNAVQAEPAVTRTRPFTVHAYLPMMHSLGKGPAGNPTVTASAPATAVNTPTSTNTAVPGVTVTPTATATPTTVRERLGDRRPSLPRASHNQHERHSPP